ncbi:MAG TPA: cupin domain-containing protein [Acidimicrobiia bacterium]|nr:cupin domain-containing protein [Acidimicrobiia bacterium]
MKDGETMPSARSTKTTRTGSNPATGVIDAAAVFAEFDNGATIVFQGMHRYWEPLADYCRALELGLGHPVQANAYITPPRAQGFAAHEDEHDVFVLQSHGTKQWRVHDRHDLPPSRPPVIDEVLAPGDSLYIPAGFPHSASTQELASVHITIGILAMTWADALEAATRLVREDPELGRPLPLDFAADTSAFTDEVRSHLEAMGESLATLDPSLLARALRRKLLTTRQPLLRGQIHRLLARDEIGDESIVTRRVGSMCVLEIVDSELSVLLGDRELRMPRWVEPAMNLIASGEKLAVADLPELDETGRLVLVRRLIGEGLLEVVG